ncbi:CHAT domain-containing protein [Streptomyces sp. NBC_00503]|uniref:CHAT domain-containing protein n=1 Tax=Streptomyces sp. NBC_00503 TaxID=2903659 RepID=UPI002E8215D6|nr:CHAT domain-containing protein [Streptomyces sp. NBC_00503]WUD85298.1 CHAT domain-containing tetratricopeptide repeat protein [Streptomyces sp. NBC_00503]
MTQTQDIIERLLLLDQLSRLPAVLEAALPFDGPELLAGLRARAATAEAGGRHAEAAFLRSLVPQVEAALPRSAATGAARAPETPAELLDRLLACGSALDQYLFARRYPELARASLPLLQAWFADARTVERERHASACAVIGVVWGGPNEQAFGRAMWAALLRRRGAPRAARRHLDRAQPDGTPAGDTLRLQLLTARTALADADGELEEAVRLAREGLTIATAHADIVAAWLCHERLAGYLRSLGRTSEALSHVNIVLESMPDHRETVAKRSGLLNLRGLIQEDLGEYDLGAADFAAAGLAAQRCGDDRLRFSAVTNGAASLSKAGRQREALQAFEQVLAEARRHHDDRRVSATLNNIGQIRLAMGDAAGARAAFRDAINASRTLPQGDSGELISWFGLADATSALGDVDSAKQLYLVALATGITSGHYETALGDYLLRGQKFDDQDRAAHLGLLQSAFTQLTSWRHRAAVGAFLAREVIRGGERERGHRLFTDLLAEAASRDPEGLECLHIRTRFASALAHELGRPRAALAEYQLARRHVQRLLARTQVPDRRAELVSEHFGIYEELLGLLVGAPESLGLTESEAWRLAFDLHEEAKSPTTLAHLGAAPLTTDRTEALLADAAPPEGMAFVSFFCGTRHTYVFVLATHAELRAERVRIGRDELQGAADELRRIFNGDPQSFPPLAPLRPRAPHRRSIAFLDALGPRLTAFAEFTAPQTLICVAPHGPLHLLPLHALPMADGARLATRNCLTYTPSLSVLAPVLRRRTPLRRTGRALFVGVAAQEDPNPELFRTDGTLLKSAGWQVTELTGSDAHSSAVLHALRTADVAHFTCHGYADPANPMESGLVLSPLGASAPPTKHIRRLSVAQRSAVLLRPSQLTDHPSVPALITLRACSSAWQAETNRGDEFAGLTRAFLQAGARSVLSTLWNVNQESSGLQVSALYSRMKADPNTPLWVCYWRAQRELLDRSDAPWLTHPYHFAPMVLNGDWR